MPIVDEALWAKWRKNNDDPYGGCYIKVAAEVMRLLDERSGQFDAHKLVCEADDNIKAGGITGFMAGAVAAMVSGCHSRGEEFRKAWNVSMQLGDEGDEANKRKNAVLNPALVTIGKKKK